ncbi:MAG: hypothetical protein ACJ8CR_27420 [Roseiflexaceae bacterium]
MARGGRRIALTIPRFAAEPVCRRIHEGEAVAHAGQIYVLAGGPAAGLSASGANEVFTP